MKTVKEYLSLSTNIGLLNSLESKIYRDKDIGIQSLLKKFMLLKMKFKQTSKPKDLSIASVLLLECCEVIEAQALAMGVSIGSSSQTTLFSKINELKIILKANTDGTGQFIGPIDKGNMLAISKLINECYQMRTRFDESQVILHQLEQGEANITARVEELDIEIESLEGQKSEVLSAVELGDVSRSEADRLLKILDSKVNDFLRIKRCLAWEQRIKKTISELSDENQEKINAMLSFGASLIIENFTKNIDRLTDSLSSLSDDEVALKLEELKNTITAAIIFASTRGVLAPEKKVNDLYELLETLQEATDNISAFRGKHGSGLAAWAGSCTRKLSKSISNDMSPNKKNIELSKRVLTAVDRRFRRFARENPENSLLDTISSEFAGSCRILEIKSKYVDGSGTIPASTPLGFITRAGKKPVAKISYNKTNTGLLKIEGSEWENVKSYIVEQDITGDVLLGKDETGLSFDFIQIEGKLFALSPGEYIGEGAFGKVAIVQDESMHNFAIKISEPPKTKDKEILYANELTILNELRSLKAAATIADRSYSIVDLELGANIYSGFIETGILEKDKLQLDAAIGCAKAVLELHKVNIVHRDIKPANFMMNVADGVVFVKPVDFGLSVKLKPDVDHGVARGPGDFSDPLTEGMVSYEGFTPGYAAPELIEDNVYSYSTDKFALGRMFHGSFGIHIPELESDDPKKRPDLESVINYLQYLKESSVDIEYSEYIKSTPSFKPSSRI